MSKEPEERLFINLVPPSGKNGFTLKEVKEVRPRRLEFKGEEILIKRADINASDLFISKEEHAVFYFKEGKWYISSPPNSKSSKNLFVQVGAKELEIKSNDIILIGRENFYYFQPKKLKPVKVEKPNKYCRICFFPLYNDNICNSCGFDNHN
jgi:hypothetical protein